MQIVSNGDTLHEMSNPVFWKNKKTISLSSAEWAKRDIWSMKKIGTLFLIRIDTLHAG